MCCGGDSAGNLSERANEQASATALPFLTIMGLVLVPSAMHCLMVLLATVATRLDRGVICISRER